MTLENDFGVPSEMLHTHVFDRVVQWHTGFTLGLREGHWREVVQRMLLGIPEP